MEFAEANNKKVDPSARPSVSVIMPAYRVTEFIGAALDSVLNQTYKDYEIIVVNDGSPDTDELERVLESYREQIRYIKQSNGGCSAARNAGLAVARGRWVAFLDGDDYWESGYLAEQVGFLESHPEVDLVYTDGLLVGCSPLAGRTFMRTTPSRGDVTPEALLAARCTVLLSGTLARRQAILDVGSFDEELRCSEDYDLWLRLAMNGGRLAYQRKVLLCKRIHPVSLSADHLNLHEHTLRVLRKTRLEGRLIEEERAALCEQEARLQATVKLERGKQKLSARDFAGAAADIREANVFYHSWKLRLMLRWLRFLPVVLLHIYNLRGQLINDRANSTIESSQSFTVRAGWLFFAKCFAFGLSFMLPLLLVRRLSQHEFGLYKQVFLIVGTAIYILPLGFGMSAFYFLARERERRGQIVFNILLFYLGMAGSACILLVLRPSLLSTLFNSGDIAAYAPQIGLVILFWVVSSFLEVVILANQEARLATFFIIISQLSKTGLMLAAALSLASVEALMNAAIVYGVLQTAMMLSYLRSRFGTFWRELNWRMVRTQLAYALPIGLASVLFQVQADLHNYFVSYHFSTADFAIYAIGCFNLPLIGILSESAGSVTIPRVSYLQKFERHREIVDLMSRMLRKLAALYFPIYLFLLVMGREFITVLFTARYASSWPIFAINLTMIPLGLVASVCDPVMRAYAEHRFFMMKVRGVVIAVLSVALWFGTSRFGLIGAITAVVVFNGIERMVIGVKVGRILGLSRRDLGLLEDVGKMAVAAVGAAGVTWMVRAYAVDAAPVVVLAMCGVVFCCAYVVALAILGVPNREERAFVERLFARLPRWSWRQTAVPVAGGGIVNGGGYGIWNPRSVVAAEGPAAVVSPILLRNPSLAIEVGELTGRRHWDSTHLTEMEFWERKKKLKESSSLNDRLKTLIKKLLGKRLLEYMGSYEEHLLWNVIYQKYLPIKAGGKVLEVGSAPGDFLVKLSETFDVVPYGIEYSENGADLNRQVFAENNLDPNNVIHGDFLSDEVHKRYESQFDMVISRGFIEHFTDAKFIVEKHLNLLARGGLLVISIPNIRGLNYLLAQIFHKELIAIHNLNIMQKQQFKELFDQSRVTPIFCDYYGTFNFGLINARQNTFLESVLGMCTKLQMILNLAFRFLLGDRGAESSLFSPSMIFIGIKRD
jgi:glycosyltransferase involved in cell wall biosynthesis/SAM-dependent methyltransferase/peptidoglycan biosynthesis protein MviN/MurJ (putative lipid II flippase)